MEKKNIYIYVNISTARKEFLHLWTGCMNTDFQRSCRDDVILIHLKLSGMILIHLT